MACKYDKLQSRAAWLWRKRRCGHGSAELGVIISILRSHCQPELNPSALGDRDMHHLSEKRSFPTVKKRSAWVFLLVEAD